VIIVIIYGAPCDGEMVYSMFFTSGNFFCLVVFVQEEQPVQP